MEALFSSSGRLYSTEQLHLYKFHAVEKPLDRLATHPREIRNTPWRFTIYRLEQVSLFPDEHLIKPNLIELSTINRTNEIIHYLESSRTPINKLNCPFRLDASNSGVHILRYHVPAVQQTTSHVLAMPWITFYHLIGWFKACTRDLSNAQLLVISFLGGDDRSVCSEREVNTRIRYQVSLG